MKFESIILSVLAAATTVVQAMPVHTHSIDANAPNKQCEDIFKMDQKETFPAECTETWNHAVSVCGIEPAPQPGAAIPAEHRHCLEAALKASDLGATQPTKRESDQDRERREREFRERRDRAERERRERDERERREREDRERREREQNNRDKDGKATNVCTHDDWKNNRPCAQP